MSRYPNRENGTTRITAGPINLDFFNEVTTEIRGYHGYDIEVTTELQVGLMTVVKLVVRQRAGGPGVTTYGLRKIAVQEVAQHSLAVDFDGPLRLSDADRLRKIGPTDETLQWVAFIYQVAQALGDPPAKAVYEAFGVSERTGGLWVQKARSKRLLA